MSKCTPALWEIKAVNNRRQSEANSTYPRLTAVGHCWAAQVQAFTSPAAPLEVHSTSQHVNVQTHFLWCYAYEFCTFREKKNGLVFNFMLNLQYRCLWSIIDGRGTSGIYKFTRKYPRLPIKSFINHYASNGQQECTNNLIDFLIICQLRRY